jgi:hypothetical protein
MQINRSAARSPGTMPRVSTADRFCAVPFEITVHHQEYHA